MSWLHPFLFELHTRRWLLALSRDAGRPVTLATVPDSEIESWHELGFTHVWLMGVWKSGPRARAVARSSPGLIEACGSVRNVGPSPYAIAEYSVPHGFGGEEGLAAFRKRLRSLGMKLLLDFVPNHLGIDHPWSFSQPHFFVRSVHPREGCLKRTLNSEPVFIAHGKDPYFPPWTDTFQLDYRLAETQEFMGGQLRAIASRCDGVRCDMAMLLLREVFEQTWRNHPPIHSPKTADEFWPGAIAAVRADHAGFVFLAEAYWNTEAQLQQMGFDYTYDKSLCDHLTRGHPERACGYLSGLTNQYIEQSAHFLENHDEPRIASLLSLDLHKLAALLTFALPGLRFFHEGQLTGARLKLPVQALRAPEEPADRDTELFYRRLFQVLKVPRMKHWRLVFPAKPPLGECTSCAILSESTDRHEPALLVGVNLAPRPFSVRMRHQLRGLDLRGYSSECVLSLGPKPRLQARLVPGGSLDLELPARSGGVWRLSRR